MGLQEKDGSSSTFVTHTGNLDLGCRTSQATEEYRGQ